MNALARLFLLLVLCTSARAYAADTAVALMYHRFADDRFPSTNIRREQLVAHLDYLVENGFNVVDLKQFMSAATEGTSLPDKAVLLTVDDAFLSVYEVAHPLMQQYGFPYTVFVSSDPVDDGLSDYMTWDQMREMQAGGATFANHGASHASTIDRSDGEGDYLARMAEDVEKGMRRLREELDPVEAVFAYPYGEYNDSVIERLSDMGYAVAFGQQSGAIGPMTLPLAMPRFPMNEAFGDMDQFPAKIGSLPLPVGSIDPPETEIITRLPLIEVTLAAGIDGPGFTGLACFVGGQGQVSIDWLEHGRRFRVGPERPFGLGRHRVNCTAPAGGGRFYWYSHPWFVIQPD